MKKNRRSFLKGAALTGAAASLSGPALFAQGQNKGFVLNGPPAGDNAPEDNMDELRPLVQAAHSEAMSKVDKIIEKEIRKPTPESSLDVGQALASEGLRLTSPGARAAAKRVQMPAAITKKNQEGKTEGWHAHVCWLSIIGIGCISHSHATW